MRETKRLSIAALTAVLSVPLLAGCDLTSREEECRAQGGAVVADDVKYIVKGGKRTVEREYECVKGGVELFEWKTRSAG